MEHAVHRGPLLVAVCFCVAIGSGCTSLRPRVDQALWENRVALSQPREPADYRVGCPDVLGVTVTGNPAWQRRAIPIGVDGRIDLSDVGRLSVEGETTGEIAAVISTRAGIPADHVHVEVAEYRSELIYVFGQVEGLERAVPFRGQETVVELLQRAGGITPAASPNEIYVVRPHVSEGKPPEVFAVKLKDILLDHDSRTNVKLEPSDQVYIGEMRRSSVGRCIPPILRPLYDGLCGMYRTGQNGNGPHPGDALSGHGTAVASSAPLALLPPPLASGN